MRILHPIITAIALLLCVAQLPAQEKNKGFRVNYGIRAGFQAVTYNGTDFNIKGYKFNENTIQSNKIGYTINPFVRFTRDEFYLQSEAAVGITLHTFDFIEENGAGENFAANVPKYELTTYCIQVPILIGYNFISYRNYQMGVFTGPRTKFILTSQSKQEFSHFTYEDLYEELPDKTYYWEVGLDVKIYNVFFDITYDWEFIKQKSAIISRETGERFECKRSDNVLSFSVGFIF